MPISVWKLLCTSTHLALRTEAGTGKRFRDVWYYRWRHVFTNKCTKCSTRAPPLPDKIVQLISRVSETWCFTNNIMIARNEIWHVHTAYKDNLQTWHSQFDAIICTQCLTQTNLLVMCLSGCRTSFSKFLDGFQWNLVLESVLNFGERT